MEALVGGTLDRYGRVDGVVNSTGHPASGEVLELTDGQWHDALDLVVLNVVRIARLVTPARLRQAGGEAVIARNVVKRNASEAPRGGISVRDAQNATIEQNRLAKNGGNSIIASGSGRQDRPPLVNIEILDNELGGEPIKGCDDEAVTCENNR